MANTADEAGRRLAHTILMGRFAKWAAISGVGAALAFVLLPQLDIGISQQFYLGSRQFAGQGNASVSAVRYGFIALYFAAAAWTVLGIAVAVTRNKRWFGLSTRQWVFAALCLTAGPGLVANLVFKDNWGRARPKEVIEFDGKLPYTPPLIAVQNCERNCSFVSGEASSMFVIFFAAAALYRRFASALLTGGVLIGTLAGAIRISQGAHFASDVVFAGVFMALTVGALFFCFESRTAGGMGRIRVSIRGPEAVT